MNICLQTKLYSAQNNVLTNSINQLNSNMAGWIDITNECDWKKNTDNSNSLYKGFMKYNPYTKQVMGSFYITEEIENQSILVILPNLGSIGVNPYIGLCGLCVHKDTANVLAIPRVKNNTIYSSHSTRASLQEAMYIINFIVA